MDFDYDFKTCPICGSKMKTVSDKIVFKCKNNCCLYSIDFPTETVDVTIFNTHCYCLELHKDCYQNYSKDTKKYLDNQMKKFLQKVNYWKENERYIMRLMDGD